MRGFFIPIASLSELNIFFKKSQHIQTYFQFILINQEFPNIISQ